jgi:hypothetical protein
MDRFIVLVMLIVWSGIAVAEKQAFACQFIASAGLMYNGDEWVTRSFELPSPFVLVMVGDTLTQESAADGMGSYFPNQVHCRVITPEIVCTSTAGMVLYFNPKVKRGGTAQLLGATEVGQFPSSLTIQPFTCQKF